jgi:hypothetical protein
MGNPSDGDILNAGTLSSLSVSESAMSKTQMQIPLLALLVLAVAQVYDVAPASADEEGAKQSQEIPSSAKATTLWESKATTSWATESALFIKLQPPTKSGEIKGVRLANVVSKIHWLGHPDQQLSLSPEPGTWHIKFDNAPEKASTIVIEFDGPPTVFDPKTVIKPSADHSVMLPAKLATTHGATLRYEPQPHKNTVGYWSNEKDTASWKFECDENGIYEVDILQGCGKGHGGSEVEVRVAGQALKFDVQETGHFQNFIWRTLGEVTLEKSEGLTLQLAPIRKAGGAVMDVRAVRLVPKGLERSKAPELADPAALPKPQ